MTTTKTVGGATIAGTTALVTGANRGLGKAYVHHLLDRGASRIYAAARNPDTIEVSDDRIVPIRLDVTHSSDVTAAAAHCGDVAVLVNNAGAMLRHPC